MYTKEDGSMVIEIPDKQEPDPYDKTYINNYIKERNILLLKKLWKNLDIHRLFYIVKKRV